MTDIRLSPGEPVVVPSGDTLWIEPGFDEPADLGSGGGAAMPGTQPTVPVRPSAGNSFARRRNPHEVSWRDIQWIEPIFQPLAVLRAELDADARSPRRRARRPPRRAPRLFDSRTAAAHFSVDRASADRSSADRSSAGRVSGNWPSAQVAHTPPGAFWGDAPEAVTEPEASAEATASPAHTHLPAISEENTAPARARDDAASRAPAALPVAYDDAAEEPHLAVPPFLEDEPEAASEPGPPPPPIELVADLELAPPAFLTATPHASPPPWVVPRAARPVTRWLQLAAAVAGVMVIAGAGYLGSGDLLANLTPHQPAPDAVTKVPPNSNQSKQETAERAPSSAPRASPGAANANIPTDPPQRGAALLASAKSGAPGAQYALAVAYARGDGIGQDYAAAARWFREAAVNGNLAAQFNLGVLYERGLGVAANMSEALVWYRSAAEHDYAPAEYNLALAFAQGRGTPTDLVAAARWYHGAAVQGLVPAMINFAILYEKGDGVGRSTVDAYAWYRAAATRGDAAGAKRAGEIYQQFSEGDRNRADALAAEVARSIHAAAPSTRTGSATVPSREKSAGPVTAAATSSS